ncbi:hypothetical protein [Lentzea sp. NPDC060358]|uniref:hypothetical protein n=1 Tax=Lentzea sp. NPDC060358 TaxID=3347103 RepID=UPI003646A648
MSEDPHAVPSPDPQGPFAPYISRRTGPGTGPDWARMWPSESLRRIRASASVEDAGVQATTEAVILLHSVRRLLMWNLVLLPSFAAASLIALLIAVMI